MGLDLTIKINKNIRHRTTGVYIREDGMNKELKTIEEVKKYFPGYDISHIKEITYVDDVLWKRHITHNLSEMARHVVVKDISLYDLLWKPTETGFNYVNGEYIDYINKSLNILVNKKDKLVKFNPTNRWGRYETLLGFVMSLAECINMIDLNCDKCIIYSSV